MSKEIRWTFYILLTAGIIGFGWYMSLTERPDAYTPQEAPYTQTSEPGAPTGAALDGEGDDGEQWAATITGQVTGTHPMTSEGRELFSIEFSYDEAPRFDDADHGEISSPINLVGSQELFEDRLGRLPKLEDQLVVETASTSPNPLLLPLHDVQFVEDDGG